MIELVVSGAEGRMGRAVLALAAESTDLRVVGRLDRSARPEGGVQTLAAYAGAGQVIIDFSSPEALAALLPIAVRHRVGLVIGTTGLDAALDARLGEASGAIPILQAANFSLGVALLAELVARVAHVWPTHDCEIVEAHHRAKVDAPSGTALHLKDRVVDARAGLSASTVVHGRSGRPGPRPVGEIGVHALRLGDVVGRHEVTFASTGESLWLGHEARSRDVFAVGALAAARFIAGRAPGRYRLADLFAAPA